MDKTSHITMPPCSGRDAAIANLGGMTWLYEKHLSKFKTTYTGASASISDLLDKGQISEARLIVHSIKGLSGTLGLTDLYYAASDLERAIIHRHPSIQDLLSIFSIQLATAVDDSHTD